MEIHVSAEKTKLMRNSAKNDSRQKDTIFHCEYNVLLGNFKMCNFTPLELLCHFPPARYISNMDAAIYATQTLQKLYTLKCRGRK